MHGLLTLSLAFFIHKFLLDVFARLKGNLLKLFASHLKHRVYLLGLLVQ